MSMPNMGNPALDLSQANTNAGVANGYIDPSGVWWPDPRDSQPVIRRDGNGNTTLSYRQPNGTWTTTPYTSPAAPGAGKPPNTRNDIPTQAGRDALARLQAILTQYGLGGLTQWVIDKLVSGATEAEIDIDLREQPAYKARFPVMAARAERGLTPLSASQVLEYEHRASEFFRAAGLPSWMQTGSPPYAQSLLARDISLAELSDRLQDGFLRVTTAPPEVRAMFGQYFGVSTDQAMAALFLDPDRALPELEKMAMTSFVGGLGNRFTVNLAQSKAREIVDTGVTEAQIWAGFAQLDQASPLFEETLSEGIDLTKEGVGVEAVFGTRPGSADVLERRRATRKAAFSGGGGGAENETGVYGFGAATR